MVFASLPTRVMCVPPLVQIAVPFPVDEKPDAPTEGTFTVEPKGHEWMMEQAQALRDDSRPASTSDPFGETRRSDTNALSKGIAWFKG